MKKILRIIFCGTLGFAAYCCLIMLEELPDLIRRGYYDWEGVVKHFASPLFVFLAFSKDFWRDTPGDVILQTWLGAALIITGVWIGARLNRRKKSSTVRM
jgi:hypothetical protein